VLGENRVSVPLFLRPIRGNDQESNPSLLGEKPATRHDIIPFDPTTVEGRYPYRHTDVILTFVTEFNFHIRLVSALAGNV